MSKVLASHPKIVSGRTIFTSSVKSPTGNILKEAHNNAKLSHSGKFILKGRWKGMPLYSLTLEERKTCPKDCFRWATCYGNNLYLANRFKHGAILQSKLSSELSKISELYPEGFVIRLHILGDFYSKKYVAFWAKMLEKFPNLNIFGYTARLPDSPIGKSIVRLILPYGTKNRVYLRFSTNGTENKEYMYAVSEEYNKPSIICPAQTGKTKSCISCGLCFQVNKTIKFLTH